MQTKGITECLEQRKEAVGAHGPRAGSTAHIPLVSVSESGPEREMNMANNLLPLYGHNPVIFNAIFVIELVPQFGEYQNGDVRRLSHSDGFVPRNCQ